MQINRHGSFYIRNGWPTKIMDAVAADELVFSPNNELVAVDTIGVGRVMIKAMRYWSAVLGITNEVKTPQGVAHHLTELGIYISQNDPYCQDIGTLWLLHRHLSQNKDEATAWWWAFNNFEQQTFTKDAFSNAFYRFLQKQGETYTRKTVEKEFDCFKNTYVSEKVFDVHKIMEEDTVPFFAPLRLLKYNGSGSFEKRKTKARDIPLDVLLYCILRDNATHFATGVEIGVDTLLESPGQVGRYMNLSYSVLLELLQQLENSGKLALVNNFGNRYIHLHDVDYGAVLRQHYRDEAR